MDAERTASARVVRLESANDALSTDLRDASDAAQLARGEVARLARLRETDSTENARRMRAELDANAAREEAKAHARRRRALRDLSSRVGRSPVEGPGGRGGPVAEDSCTGCSDDDVKPSSPASESRLDAEARENLRRGSLMKRTGSSPPPLSLAACGLARPARAPLARQVGGEGVVPGVRGMGRVGRRGPRDAAAVPRWLRTAGDEASRARRRGRGRVPGAGASRGEAVQRAAGVPAGGLGGSGGKAVNGRWSTWRAPVDFESRRLTDVAECRGFSGGDAGVRDAGATGRGTGAGRGRGGVGRCVC